MAAIGRNQYSASGPAGAALSDRDPALYRAFGVRIRSELALPELLPASQDADAEVEILFGPVPAELPGALARGVRFQSAPNALRLQVDGVASFLVTDGSRIVIDRAAGASDADLRTFLVASPLAAVLHQRGDLVLHASAILWGGEAVCFMGPSGIGKSTLANAFRKRGHALITDDLCIVRAGPDGTMLAFPGFPHTKLWPDSLSRLEIASEGLPKVRSMLEKRIVSVKHDFHTEPVRIRHLYVLGTHNADTIDALPIQGPMKFNVLKRQTYRFGFLPDAQSHAIHFRRAFDLAQRVDMTGVRRPNGWFQLDGLVERIEDRLRA